jgi:uncharacterized membrane protein
MVTTLTVLKSIHVLAAVFWVGGGFLMNVGMTLAARAKEPPRTLAMMKLADFVGLRVFLPLALIVLGTGIWLTEKYYDFDLLWIELSLCGILVVTALLAFYMVPKTRTAVKAIEAGAGPPPKPSKVPLVGRFNLLVVSAIVVLMVIRPT